MPLEPPLLMSVDDQPEARREYAQLLRLHAPGLLPLAVAHQQEPHPRMPRQYPRHREQQVDDPLDLEQAPIQRVALLPGHARRYRGRFFRRQRLCEFLEEPVCIDG